MASTLTIDPALSKAEKYTTILPQMASLIQGESNAVANMANFSAVIKEVWGHHWVGFYTVEDDQLVLGPFQGPIACTRLFKGKGVCAAAWESEETVVVEDVDAFPGHVACSSLSRSEIVVPVKNANNEVVAVLDIDSDQLAAFDQEDKAGLEALVELLKPCM
ncbi:GAF domain-containing protein [Sanyastnella coralliicola]|uniref:GAF domain-containing protein n=1 Tax=Sanyastnella coralliicola TaxID=3069118 RepID=UPI0027B9570A|nr:GAF domain-containing protein [Longitalea sp. SCSIO 12813]